MTPIDLKERVAIITGASRGIGAAVAKELASLDATVVLLARDEEQVRRNADAIIEDGGSALAIQCDVSRADAFASAVAQTRRLFGRVDILVNNAGTIDPIARITDGDADAWSRAIDVNVKGVYYGLRAVIPIMVAQGDGVIVNMSSGAANSALEGWSHYCASKAAAKKLTECAHKEFGALGVRVVGLSPGTVATDMMATIKESGINPVSQLDWSRHISPESAARAVAFLCGPEGAEFAGTDFSIKTEEGRRRVGLS